MLWSIIFSLFLFIESPRGIIISGVHIEYSPGYAIVVFDVLANELPEDQFFPTDSFNPDLAVIDCYHLLQ